MRVEPVEQIVRVRDDAVFSSTLEVLVCDETNQDDVEVVVH